MYYLRVFLRVNIKYNVKNSLHLRSGLKLLWKALQCQDILCKIVFNFQS